MSDSTNIVSDDEAGLPESATPSPTERMQATRLCSRLKVQPTDFTAEEWLEMAIKAGEKKMPKAYPADDWLAMAALAERFPGRTFR